MNITEAKTQIKNAMKAYFTKNDFGEYIIPIERQRPVFLMGPPGIGKTAIMEQIASELGVALVSYSMTHHTRQSALGLPFIVKKTYGGEEYNVSEYTMSEIIASVYEMMEQSGLKEGILFLDEINCVSETLAPPMLQFLQYKIFGRHRVPDGWIVVTAGNPPEYNKSVREFDVVTWDRLKRIDVEPDFEAWKEYAYQKAVHPSVMTYLQTKNADFYSIETTVDGKSFVTARGWTDLSDMIRLYETNDIKVNEALISQYLQNRKIAKNFSIYYDLFNKYKSDYQVDQILSGKASDVIKGRAISAKFDERLSLLGLILDAVNEKTREVCNAEEAQRELLDALKQLRLILARPGSEATNAIQALIDERRNKLTMESKAYAVSDDKKHAIQGAINALEQQKELLLKKRQPINSTAFALLKEDYDTRGAELKKQAAGVGKKLSNAFKFVEEVFREGQEILILVTELTIDRYSAHFISRYGCDEYFAHNKELLFYERQREIIRDLENLDL